MILLDFIAAVAAYVFITLAGWYLMLEPLIGVAGIACLIAFVITVPMVQKRA